MRALVACFGNVLRGDDGFGPAVASRMQVGPLPAGVEVMEVGIGGIHLVQELLDPVDVLVVVDAVDLGRAPGAVVVVVPEVVDVAALPVHQRRDQLADMHYATPERALMLARGLGTLPERTWLVGCQVAEPGSLGQGLSPAVAGAVGPAASEVRRLLAVACPPPGPEA
jgi:hydrogenase maturation protease